MMKLLKPILVGGLFAAAAMVTPTAIADPSFEVEPITQGQLPGSLLHNPMRITWEPEGNNKRVQIVDSDGVPGAQAISFQVKRKSKNPWDINMRAPYEKNVSKGETVEIYFWARASSIPRGKDTGKVTIALGRNQEPYDTVIAQEILPTEIWKMYRVSGVAGEDFPVDQSDMGFNFGHMKQTIELGPFFAITRGQAPATAPTATVDPASDEASAETKTTGSFVWVHGDGVSSAPVVGEAAGMAGLRVTNDQDQDEVWMAQAGGSDLDQGVAAGDELTLRFWARVASGMGDITALVDRNSEPYDEVISQPFILSSDWEQYSVYGISPLDIAADDLRVVVHLGHDLQTIELGSFELVKLN